MKKLVRLFLRIRGWHVVVVSLLVLLGCIYGIVWSARSSFRGDSRNQVSHVFHHPTSNEYCDIDGFLQGGEIYYRFDATFEDIFRYVEENHLFEISSDDPSAKEFRKPPRTWWQPRPWPAGRYFRWGRTGACGFSYDGNGTCYIRMSKG